MEHKSSWHDACLAPQQEPERQQPSPAVPLCQSPPDNDERAREAATTTATFSANKREYVFLFLIALTQMIQIMPLGVGINSGLFIGAQLGATPVQAIWVVASFPMTQGSFVLIGLSAPHPTPSVLIPPIRFPIYLLGRKVKLD